MTEPDKYRLYLYDLGHFVKEEALDSKRKLEAASPGTDKSYEEGQLIAFYRIITLMQQQAEGFDIPLKDLQLEDIEPDRDLI